MIFASEIEEMEELRSGYGFVESFSKPYDGSSYARINIVFDVVDAEAFNSGVAEDRSPIHLSMVRIMTTQKRLEDLFEISSSIKEGDWFHIRLGMHSGMPRAWLLEARNDYSESVIALNLTGLSRVGGGLGGTVKPDGKLRALREWCKIEGRPADGKAAVTGATNLHVRIVDVGHASFSAIHIAPSHRSKIIGYFDVGGPIYFHHHTFPKAFKDQGLIPRNGFVALSHWDFDHYSLAVTKMKGLQKLTWYAPEQLVGPNAARLQSLLGSKLNFVHTPTYQILNGLQMWKGGGASDDRNNSGYVLNVQNGAGGTLLTGDTDYDFIPAGAKTNLVALSVTHHGGSGAGNPPAPMANNAVAAVSFGLPNRYHHPNWKDIEKHELAGWSVQPTFLTPKNRGDVWLP
ncbi:hypothetical protein [Janthinobacterium sp. J1-1]|uniref:hypothetical protein n=1 Tax=Janthinobacterium sp. J1-1 TaxID=3065910 RepID=UPI0028122471|nr:hypothetical protein [Janthinobacterium sp. J1-1]